MLHLSEPSNGWREPQLVTTRRNIVTKEPKENSKYTAGKSMVVKGRDARDACIAEITCAAHHILLTKGTGTANP